MGKIPEWSIFRKYPECDVITLVGFRIPVAGKIPWSNTGPTGGVSAIECDPVDTGKLGSILVEHLKLINFRLK